MPRLSVLALVGFATFAFSTVANAACPTFHTLTNGSAADAGQVMDNFNHILGCAQFTGNISVGTTPFAWGSPFDFAIDIGSTSAIDTSSSSLVIDLMDNMYYNGSNYIMKTTSYGNLFRLGSNDFQWWQAPSTLAGSAASPSEIMSLDFYGNLTISGCLNYHSGTSGTCLSDARVKRNIEPFTSLGLAQISALRPVTYSYNGLGGTPDDLTVGGAREGLIAQEVRKVAPDLVSTVRRKLRPSDRATTALLEVNYGALTFGLINAVKELKAVNDNQAAKIAQLEARLGRLERQASEAQNVDSQVDVHERAARIRSIAETSSRRMSND